MLLRLLVSLLALVGLIYLLASGIATGLWLWLVVACIVTLVLGTLVTTLDYYRR